MRPLIIALTILWLGATQAQAVEYKPNTLRKITLCADSAIWVDSLKLFREGDRRGAFRMLSFAVSTGRCAQFPSVTYRPDAIVQKWDNDGTGAAGVVLAGHIINQDGSTGQRAFGWFEPEFVEKHFVLNAPKA